MLYMYMFPNFLGLLTCMTFILLSTNYYTMYIQKKKKSFLQEILQVSCVTLFFIFSS